MHTSRRSILLALIAGCMTLAPTAAEAQLGGFLKKKLEDKVADKVLGPESSSRAPAPKFDDQVLEITEARLDQLLKGVEAEGAAAESARRAEARAKQQGESRRASYEAEKKAYDTKMAEFQAAYEKYTKCQMGVVGRGAATSMQNPTMMKMAQKMMALPDAERDAFQERVEKRQEAMQAAEARGDKATQAKLAAEMDTDLQKTVGISFAELQAANASSGQGAMNMQAELNKCGSEPVPPKEPEDPTMVSIDVRDSVRTAAFRASGLSDAQYSILRERVAAWLAHKERNRSLMRYGFTDGELAVLQARHSALKARKDAILAEDSAAGWRI